MTKKIILGLLFLAVNSFSQTTNKVQQQNLGSFNGEIDSINYFFSENNERICNNKLYPFKEKGKWGIVDSKQNIIVKAKYDAILGNSAVPNAFWPNYIWVSENHKEGLLFVKNCRSTEIIKPVYDYIFPYLRGIPYFKTEKNKCFGMFNGNGKLIVDAINEEVWSPKSGYCVVKTEGKYAFLDTASRKLLSQRFDDANNFINDIAKVTTKGKTFFIDKKGNSIQGYYTLNSNNTYGRDNLVFHQGQKPDTLSYEIKTYYKENTYWEQPFFYLKNKQLEKDLNDSISIQMNHLADTTADGKKIYDMCFEKNEKITDLYINEYFASFSTVTDNAYYEMFDYNWPSSYNFHLNHGQVTYLKMKDIFRNKDMVKEFFSILKTSFIFYDDSNKNKKVNYFNWPKELIENGEFLQTSGSLSFYSFMLKTTGIVIFFVPEEGGFQYVTEEIPYEKIKHLLDPNGPLGYLLK